MLRLQMLVIMFGLFGLAMPDSGSRPGEGRPQEDALGRLAGEWLFVADRTEGRAPEKTQPPMSFKFSLRVEKDAVVMQRGRRAEERIPLDGTVIEAPQGQSMRRSSGSWKDGTLVDRVEFVRTADQVVTTVIRKEYTPTAEGLLVRVVTIEPPEKVIMDGIALYRHPEDIELPKPAKAAIADVAWLSGDWVGERRNASIEERWGPPLGGAMLGTSRTVKNGRMSAFEYLRIVERDGGLVYVAQPGGIPPTEFVLTELGEKRAVFDNPRHDSPQRIVYELTDAGLVATTSFVHSGPYYRFEFKAEGD